MRVVDMHCDTILELLSRDLKGKEASLYSNDLSIDLEKMKKGNYLLQNFALFTDQKELAIPEQQTMRLYDEYCTQMDKYADYIIHVVDASNPQAELQMHTVYETLRELGATGKKIITLLNKQDQVQGESLRDFRADYTVKCSARTGKGLEELKDVLAKLLAESQIYLEELYTYKEAGKIQIIREYGSLLSEEYREDGIFVKARVPAEIFVSVMPKSHK